MCLITDQKTPIITKQKKTVYKILNVFGTSIMQSFEYEFERLYKTRIKREPKDITSAADDDADKWVCKKFGKEWREDKRLISIAEGFHSFNKTGRMSNYKIYGYEEFKCTIPAGSEIYKDGTGLIVSNQIIIHAKK